MIFPAINLHLWLGISIAMLNFACAQRRFVTDLNTVRVRRAPESLRDGNRRPEEEEEEEEQGIIKTF